MNLTARADRVLSAAIGFEFLDLHVVRAAGTRVHDVSGREYLDFCTGTATTTLGHNHPGVMERMRRQLEAFVHSGCTWLYEPIVEAAEALARVTPPRIESFFFSNSGAEAVEGAVKVAKYATGRQGVVAFRGGFHGRTSGSVAFTTSKAFYRDPYHPILPSVFITAFPHPYREGVSEEESVARAVGELEAIFKHEVGPHRIAAFLIEPQQGEGGYYPAPADFVRYLRDVADEHGILLISDEVQTGFGRTGTWWGIEHTGVEPDLVALGKGIANGMPLSAVGGPRDIVGAWPEGLHGSTFGGNPVSCAALLGVIEAIETEGLLARGTAIGERARRGFTALAERHDCIGDVRGLGPMLGIEIVADRATRTPAKALLQRIQEECRAEGFLFLKCGPDLNIIRYIPPLVATDEEIDLSVEIVGRSIEKAEAALV